MQTLHLIMGRGRWDADALAEELSCSRRTVFRLLQTLSMAGIPWYFDERLRAYKVRPGFKFPMLDEHLSKLPQPEILPEELDILTDKLIRQGEAFSNTLQEFLAALKESTGRKSDH
tara:strand:- start:89281 stop:89628 length:348 start_codon:yes stop_codon:yes gene_type:complete